MYMINKLIIFIIAFNIYSAATITGSVYDAKNGTSLIGANVYLENTPYGSSSNLDGQYIINNIPKNNSYTIIVTYLGYKKYTEEIDLFVDGEVLSLDIMLEPTKIKVKAAEIVGRKSWKEAAKTGRDNWRRIEVWIWLFILVHFNIF